MTDLDLTGVYPAMCTPFHDDGSIDHETLTENALRLQSEGVDGLVPVGSTGESATLSHDEHIEVIETVVDAVDIPVIGGSGSNSTREAVKLSRRAAEAGCDGLLLISPYYNKPTQNGFRNHYLQIADEVDLPQIVYNVPSRTGKSLEPETVADLADHRNIAGYKAAGGDMGRISEIIEKTRMYDFNVLSGNDGETLPILSMGGTGCISVAANVEPDLVCNMVQIALNGDLTVARETHHSLSPLFRAMFIETNPIPVKKALEIQGHGNGNLRPPLTEMNNENQKELQTVLDRY